MAMSTYRLLACLPALSIALLAQSVTLLAQSPVPQHPLDGLTSSEYWAVHDILHKSGHMTADTGVSTLVLHEPLKSTVLAWKPGDPIEREADVILEDKGQTIEARVDITGGKLESWSRTTPGCRRLLRSATSRTSAPFIAGRAHWP